MTDYIYSLDPTKTDKNRFLDMLKPQFKRILAKAQIDIYLSKIDGITRTTITITHPE